MAKVTRKENCITVQNSFLRNKNLSLKAKGLYAYIASFDKNWNFTIKSISKQLKEGQDSIKAGLRELKEHGYLTYSKSYDGTGVYTLYNKPNYVNNLDLRFAI